LTVTKLLIFSDFREFVQRNMSDNNQDETLRRQFRQLQEQQQKRLQLAQQRCNVKLSKQQSHDSGSDKEASTFDIADDMDLKVRIKK